MTVVYILTYIRHNGDVSPKPVVDNITAYCKINTKKAGNLRCVL